ncbi:hypothetical protein GAH_00810 [Geoglobus ahangari]|uniref:DUF1284 domain-containing protein n=1 Tax=Geoglobus ahangari TaxID=113653 RepID=A0A0F7IEB2_9EURY|nr:DUF1284 domain-containing protein [Geoglobus ahangari]AKG91858.1 hypothetical protein GAH_00810 [Geoglobus ahangari]
MSRLRGHHLICLNFFKGEGYSEDFVENLRRVVSDSEIEVVFGADDVCERCPYLKDGVCSYSESAEEEVTELDQMAYRLLSTYPGQRTTWHEVKEKLPEIMRTWKEFACSECDWKTVCEEHEEWKKY